MNDFDKYHLASQPTGSQQGQQQSSWWRFCVIFIVGLLVIGGYTLSSSFYLFENLVKVTTYDYTYVAGNGGKIWLHSDEFVPVTNIVGNSTEMNKQQSNKRFVKVYGIPNKAVLKEMLIYQNEDVAPPRDRLLSYDGNVWVINDQDKKHPYSLQVFDGATFEQTMDLNSFTKKFPALKGGIAESAFYEDPMRLQILTKDGQKLFYYFKEDRIFDAVSGSKNPLQDAAIGNVTYFMLSGKNPGDLQKKLYKITQEASSSFLKHYTVLSSALANPERLEKTFQVGDASLLLDGEIFLDGQIVYADDRAVLVRYKTELGADGAVVLTYIVDGKEQWTVSKVEVPVLAQLDPHFNTDPFLAMAKAPLGQKDADVVVLTLDRVGIVGLDVASGKQLWFFDGKEGNFR